MLKWLVNPSTGREDTMLTVAIASTAVVLLKFAFSDLSFGAVTFGKLDGGVIAAILTPTLGVYAARRYTDKKIEAVASKGNDDASE